MPVVSKKVIDDILLEQKSKPRCSEEFRTIFQSHMENFALQLALHPLDMQKLHNISKHRIGLSKVRKLKINKEIWSSEQDFADVLESQTRILLDSCEIAMSHANRKTLMPSDLLVVLSITSVTLFS